MNARHSQSALSVWPYELSPDKREKPLLAENQYPKPNAPLERDNSHGYRSLLLIILSDERDLYRCLGPGLRLLLHDGCSRWATNRTRIEERYLSLAGAACADICRDYRDRSNLEECTSRPEWAGSYGEHLRFGYRQVNIDDNSEFG